MSDGAAASAHAAIVLAAGGSRRLGHPKQLLTRGGEALVHRAVRLAVASGATRVVAVLGCGHARVAQAIADLDVEVHVNAHWEQGLAGSLQLAAHALQEHASSSIAAMAPVARVLILGCDQPALEAAHLQQLLSGSAVAASGCAATVHGERLGSPAAVPVAWLQSMQDLQGDRGFGAHLNAFAPDRVWRLHAPELQLDIDTPENEQAAIARGLLDGA
ncbi:nucleotidyltransferase family protein [Lysobacter solisilvae (ex Woo and Kim 2020)]|uniref:Nucleotidyltransferase family protein n=1 Tax=Agrilutibacter terrestris TaxID=2865112 RepID=A0A7H0FUJ2_9GAMM|nr:nucleotidyltransferase family protein [Lysobacter terrestris]QNP39708.1 nucleotidyltransferase family protein [Lysobacter terrestris]